MPAQNLLGLCLCLYTDLLDYWLELSSPFYSTVYCYYTLKYGLFRDWAWKFFQVWVFVPQWIRTATQQDKGDSGPIFYHLCYAASLNTLVIILLIFVNIKYVTHLWMFFRILCTGDFIFSSSYDKTIKAWLFDTCEIEEHQESEACIRTFTGHGKGVYPIIFIPAEDFDLHDGATINPGDTLISGSADCCARSWSFDTGGCLKVSKLLIHEADTQSIFSHMSSVCPSSFFLQNFAKQNKFQLRIVITSGWTVDLAEWIIYTCLVLHNSS